MHLVNNTGMKKFYTALSFCFMCLLAFASPPVTPATNLTSNNIDGNRFNITWTNGSGARRIVVMKAGSPVTSLPADGVDYIDNATFGNGSTLGAGEFVVYDNIPGSVTINGLSPNITYHIAIFEYNGSNTTTEYLATALTGTISTLAAPTQQASNIVFSNVATTTFTISCTKGNGTARIIVMREGSAVNSSPNNLSNYSGNTYFGNGTAVGTGNYTMYSGSDNSLDAVNLKANTTYHVAVFEYNGSNGKVYLTPGATGSITTNARPNLPPTGIRPNLIDGKELKLMWTSGNGTKRIVVVKKAGAITGMPTDGMDYTANSIFGNGQTLNTGEYIVYNSNGTEAFFSNLEPSTLYHYSIFEYNTINGNILYAATAASGTISTATMPTEVGKNPTATFIKADYMYLNVSPGNGSGRILVGKKGSAVDATPQDLVRYTGNQTFGQGEELGTGNYVINAQNLYGLEAGVTYYFAYFEFNGVNQPIYNPDPVRFSATTVARPTTPASGIGGNKEGTYINPGWTNGNGNRRIVVAKQGSDPTSLPQDNTTYSAGTDVFGTGTELAAGEFVVYNGTNNSGYVYGLQPGTTYHLRVYEYNLVAGQPLYLTTSYASGTNTTLSTPTAQPTAITASSITQTGMTISWTPGNGGFRVLVGREGEPVNGLPVDGNTYSSTSVFGSTLPNYIMGTGNHVLFGSSNSGNSVNVTNLQPGTTYYFTMFEFNGRLGPAYMRPGSTQVSFTTQTSIQAPTTPASALQTSNLEGNSLRLSFTKGNGNNRVVIARAGSPVTTTLTDGTSYIANAQFGNGQNLGDNQYVVYNGSGTIADVTNLQKNTSYYFAVIEYNGTAATSKYQSTAIPGASGTTLTAPTITTTAISFTAVGSTQATINWTNGNGTNRIILMRANDPVTGTPVDYTAYSSNVSFGIGAAIGSGNYVVYKGTGTNVTVTNLQPGLTYHIAAYEYNGTTGPVYLTTATTGSVLTVGAPQTQTSTIVFSQVAGNSVQLNWTNGNGQRRLVIARKNSAVNVSPTDNSSYVANSIFGTGELLGTDNYVVYAGNGNAVSVTGLQGLSTYHFAIFEYNDFGSNVLRYLSVNPARSSATTSTVLPVKLSSFTAKATGTTVQLNWVTDNEENTRHFNLQSGTDGVLFHTIATINATGNSSTRQQYSSTDQPVATGRIYYKLEIVDIDGRKEYSNVQSVVISQPTVIRLYPNPAQDRI